MMGCMTKNHIPSYTIIYHHIPSYAIIYHHIPSFIIIYHHIPSYAIIYHHIPSYAIIYHHIPSYAIIYHHIPSYAIIYHHMPSYTINHPINHPMFNDPQISHPSFFVSWHNPYPRPRQAGPVATSHVLQGTWQLDGGPGVANNPQLQMMTDRLTWIRHLARKIYAIFLEIWRKGVSWTLSIF